MLPLAAYARVSRVGDRDDTLISPELQAQRIRQYAEARELRVEYLPAELDVSGGKVERPILEQIITGIENGRYGGIITADIDRLSRMNLVDALHVIQRIEAAGGQVIAVAQNFDGSTPEGEWARNVWLSTANMMLKRYSASFRSSKESAVARGVWPIARAPIGYTVTRRKHGGDGKLKPDPEKVDDVVAIFRARANGEPWSRIACRHGLGQTNVAKIVRNRVYLGEIHLGDLVNSAAHEPIVDRGLWEAAQIEHPRPARRGNAPALLGGIVRCAGCQCAMTISGGGHGDFFYRCTPNNKAAGRCQAPAIISRSKLEQYVEPLALREIARLTLSAREGSREYDRANDQLARADAELTAYHTATRVSEIGGGAFVAGVQAREREVEEARQAVAAAWAAATPVHDSGPATLGELWPELEIEERRHVLRSSLGVIWVRKGKGDASERVRVVVRGFEPARLTGGRRVKLAPVDWIDDLPGEIRPSAEDLAKA